jgi:hypothetical protein
MRSQLDAYFAAEMLESLAFAGVAMAAIAFSVFAFWRLRDPLWKGMAIPLLLVGLIQLGVGATIFARTDAQVAALKAQYQSAPASFKAQELSRMRVVSSSFATYKVIEVAFIVIGLVLALTRRAGRFWRGIGVGMLIQGALMLPADLLAEDRAADYIRAIEAIR